MKHKRGLKQAKGSKGRVNINSLNLRESDSEAEGFCSIYLRKQAASEEVEQPETLAADS